MTKNKIRWIVATYPKSQPGNVSQVGIFMTKKAAQQCVRRYIAAEHYLMATKEHELVIFKAEIVETMQ